MAALWIAGCAAPAQAQEPSLREMHEAGAGERVDDVVRGVDGFYVLSAGRAVGRFEHGKALTLPPDSTGPLDGALGANQKLVVSASGTAIGRVTYGEENGAVTARFALLRAGQVAWQADVGPRSSFHLADDGTVLVTADPRGHGPQAPNAVTLVGEGGAPGPGAALPADMPAVTGVHVTPSGDHVAVGTMDGKIHVYDRAGRSLHVVEGSGDPILSADGRTLVVREAAGATVYVDGVATAKIRPRGAARAAAVTSSGSYVAVVTRRTVHVLEMRTGRQRALAVGLRVDEELRSVALTDEPFRVVLGSLVVATPPSETGPGAALALVRVLTRPDDDPEPLTFTTADWLSGDPQIRLNPGEAAAQVITRDRVLWLEFGR